MKLVDENNGFEITLEYDGDGFPIVTINTGGGFKDEHGRPTLDVKVNDTLIYPMFSHDRIGEIVAAHPHSEGDFKITMESDEFGKEDFNYDTLAGAKEGWEQLKQDVAKCKKKDGIARDLEMVLMLTPDEDEK